MDGHGGRGGRKRARADADHLASGSDDGAGPAAKRKAGRPPGSRTKLQASSPPLIPVVIQLGDGEDVVEVLKALSRSYCRSLVVLAAAGQLSSATLMQTQSGGAASVARLQEDAPMMLLSLSGAVLQAVQAAEDEDASGSHGREPTVFMSATLTRPQGGVVGGQVAGALETSGPMTLVVGHWTADSRGPLPLGLTKKKRLYSGPAAPDAPAQQHQHQHHQHHPAVGPSGHYPAGVMPTAQQQHAALAALTALTGAGAGTGADDADEGDEGYE